jgi:hypothetical protein
MGKGRRQTNWVFATAGERDAADGILDGDRCIITSDYSEHYYDGSAWRPAIAGGTQRTLSWAFQTNEAEQYAGGFYERVEGDNDFAPAINFGVVNSPTAAHFFVVTTGALLAAPVTIRVTGTSITDAGVRTPADTEDLVFSGSVTSGDYAETAKKWIGQVQIETVSGVPFACNYGWAKYHDVGNQNFVVLGIETLWESDSTDSTSDIELLHHRTTGWKFNAAGRADPPGPLAARSTDYAPEDVHRVGPGAWKRADLNTLIAGSASEGILFRVTSGSTGIGSLSFRGLTLEVTIALA